MESKKREEYNDFIVTFKVEARYTTPVRARTLKEALELAESEFIDANFGEAEDIDGEAIKVENEEGDYIWEKEK